MANPKEFDPQVIATTCMSVVENTLKSVCNVSFSGTPEFKPRNIIEYNSRMRVFGMEIFNAPCLISVINYYLTKEDLKAHKACGAFVLYMEETASHRLLKMFNREFDEEDEANVFDTLGELNNLIAGGYKNELSQLGYIDLVMSAPYNYRNSVPQGVEFSYDQYIKYEVVFPIWKEKIMAVDITMRPIPEKK